MSKRGVSPMWVELLRARVPRVVSGEHAAQAAEACLLDVRRATVSLFEIDPDLAGGLSAEEFEVARTMLAVPTEVVARGPWSAPRSASPLAVGLLIVEGMMVRELQLGGTTRYAELLGPGDLLRPWQDEDGGGLLPLSSSWRALEDCTVAGLGPGIARAAGRWPDVMAQITSRAVDRARKQTIAAAIPSLVRIRDRMVVLFAHLAERWGHVTPDGIVVRLPVTHALIGTLIGARRPTVTTALTALKAAGIVTRPMPHLWLIDEGIRDEVASICDRQSAGEDPRALLAA